MNIDILNNSEDSTKEVHHKKHSELYIYAKEYENLGIDKTVYEISKNKNESFAYILDIPKYYEEKTQIYDSCRIQRTNLIHEIQNNINSYKNPETKESYLEKPQEILESDLREIDILLKEIYEFNYNYYPWQKGKIQEQRKEAYEKSKRFLLDNTRLSNHIHSYGILDYDEDLTRHLVRLKREIIETIQKKDTEVGDSQVYNYLDKKVNQTKSVLEQYRNNQKPKDKTFDYYSALYEFYESLRYDYLENTYLQNEKWWGDGFSMNAEEIIGKFESIDTFMNLDMGEKLEIFFDLIQSARGFTAESITLLGKIIKIENRNLLYHPSKEQQGIIEKFIHEMGHYKYFDMRLTYQIANAFLTGILDLTVDVTIGLLVLVPKPEQLVRDIKEIPVIISDIINHGIINYIKKFGEYFQKNPNEAVQNICYGAPYGFLTKVLFQDTMNKGVNIGKILMGKSQEASDIFSISKTGERALQSTPNIPNAFSYGVVGMAKGIGKGYEWNEMKPMRELEKKLHKNKKTRDGLEETIKKLEGEKNKWKEKIQKLEETKKSVEQEIKIVENSITLQKAKIQQQKKEIEKENKDIEKEIDIEPYNKKLQDFIAYYKKELKHTLQNNKEHNELIKKFQERLGTKKQIYKNYQSIEKKLEEKEQQINVMVEECNTLYTQKESIKRERDNYKNAWEEKMKEAEKKENLIQDTNNIALKQAFEKEREDLQQGAEYDYLQYTNKQKELDTINIDISLKSIKIHEETIEQMKINSELIDASIQIHKVNIEEVNFAQGITNILHKSKPLSPEDTKYIMIAQEYFPHLKKMHQDKIKNYQNGKQGLDTFMTRILPQNIKLEKQSIAINKKSTKLIEKFLTSRKKVKQQDEKLNTLRAREGYLNSEIEQNIQSIQQKKQNIKKNIASKQKEHNTLKTQKNTLQKEIGKIKENTQTITQGSTKIIEGSIRVTQDSGSYLKNIQKENKK